MVKFVFILLGLTFCEGFNADLNHEFLSLINNDDFEKFSFSDLDVSPDCKRDLFEYYRGVKEKEKWAVAMLDSMEKFPSGLLLGRRMAVGHFDECVGAVHPNFTGQHCMVEVALNLNSKNYTVSQLPNFPERLLRNQFSYGVCLPSTCNASDLKTVIEAFGIRNEIIKIEIKEGGCNTGRLLELRVKDYFAIFLLLFIFLITLASTAYDVLHTVVRKTDSVLYIQAENVTLSILYITTKECHFTHTHTADTIYVSVCKMTPVFGNCPQWSEINKKILTSFSLYSNAKLLFQISDTLPEMHAIYGIRFLSMTWVVLGHLCSSLVYGYEVNNFDKMSILSSKSAILATNAYVCVDSFFFLSGLLVCFVFFRDLSKKGSYDAPVALIHRYLRLTPSLAMMLLFHFTIFSRISIAPYWKPVFQEIESSCREYWWTYFLYVQNYFYPDTRKCFSPAWYLCADMHMFILSPLILYFLLLWPKLAPAYLLMLIFGSSLTSFITCFRDDLPPNRSTEPFRSTNAKSQVNEYVWFHTRMTPWLVGLATGYIICGIRAKQITFRPKKIWIVIGWVTCAFLCLSSLYGIAAFFPYESHRSRLAKSSYRAFHRLGWALGLSWIVIACVNDYGGPVNVFLSLKIFQPLAKLSYCTFLVHISVQLYRHFNDSRSLKYFDFFGMVYTFFGDLIISIIISIPMTLLFEMPFTHMERIMLQKLKIFPFPKPTKSDLIINKNQASVFAGEPKKEKPTY